MRHKPLVFMCLAALVGGCMPIELSVSPDGSVLIPRQEGFVTFKPADGKVGMLVKADDTEPVAGLWSPDGKTALLLAKPKGSSNLSVVLHDVAAGTGKKVAVLSNITYVQWSPDGKYVTLTRIADKKVPPLEKNMPELILLDVATGKRKTIAQNVTMIHRWFPDSKGILTFQVAAKSEKKDQYSGSLVRLDVATGQTDPLVAALGGQKVFFDLSPDGKQALFTAMLADQAGATLPAETEEKEKLFELDVAAKTAKTVVNNVLLYALYSPKGGRVLLGIKDGDNVTLSVAPKGDLAQAKTVARDAAASTGSGMGASSDIYPTWLDNDAVLYLRSHAVYGNTGKNLQLTKVGVGGKGVKVYQGTIDSAMEK